MLSDHGMAKVQGEWITLDKYFADGGAFEKIVGSSLYAKSDADAERVYEGLKGKSDRFEVYRRGQMPAALHADEQCADGRSGGGDEWFLIWCGFLCRGSRLRTSTMASEGTAGARHDEVGAHGFDPARVPEMKASFFAAGPDICGGVIGGAV